MTKIVVPEPPVRPLSRDAWDRGARKLLAAKPSRLIRIALADLRRAEESKRYVVDMGKWHVRDLNKGVCYVCLGGAALIGCGIPSSATLTPIADDTAVRLPNVIAERILALDAFRNGEVHIGLGILGLAHAICRVPENVLVYSYVGEWSGNFFRSMRSLAFILAEAGL